MHFNVGVGRMGKTHKKGLDQELDGTDLIHLFFLPIHYCI